MGVKISELTSMGTLAGTEKLAGVDTGTQYTTPDDLKTYISFISSYMRYSNGLTRGSGNTNIVRYGTAQESSGSGISITQSSTNGDYFTVSVNGEYNISVLCGSTDAGVSAELCIGSSLSNSFDTSNTRSGAFTSGTGTMLSFSWSGYVATTDKIWVLFNGNTSGSANRNQITIRRAK